MPVHRFDLVAVVLLDDAAADLERRRQLARIIFVILNEVKDLARSSARLNERPVTPTS
jgi:hypothetical protein